MKELSKTVYSVGTPRTRRIITETMAKPESARVSENAWTGWQDNENEPFFLSWRRWSQDELSFDVDDFPFRYPTAGSSEAIREQLVHLWRCGKSLAVLDGEYEGYAMTAMALGMPVTVLPERSPESLTELRPGLDVLFISQPSAIDGRNWTGFSGLLREADRIGIDVFVDLTYLGATTHSIHIDLRGHQCVKGIFFSLSKIFGTYYHRIGGAWMREENPLLYPTIWFKNVLSMRIGRALMDDRPMGDLHPDLAAMQTKALSKLGADGFLVRAADVHLLGEMRLTDAADKGVPESWRRGSSGVVRVCLSPSMGVEE